MASDDAAAVLAAAFLRHCADVLGALQRAARPRHRALARFGERNRSAALAYQQVHAELLLELSQLLANGGLSGVQVGRGARYVESRIHHGAQALQLTQLHLRNEVHAATYFNHLPPSTIRFSPVT